jgi:hydroxylamine reductase
MFYSSERHQTRQQSILYPKEDVMGMFCYQCEQAAKGTGCDIAGVCGKKPEIAALQDILLYQTKGIGYLAHEARLKGRTDIAIDRFITKALFTTVTNVDFDSERIIEWIQVGERMRRQAAQLVNELSDAPPREIWPAAATFTPAHDLDELLDQAESNEGIGVKAGVSDPDLHSLRELLTYGLKGMAAYADHAAILGKEDQAVYAFFEEALALLTKDNLDMETLVDANMRCGAINITTMELLDNGHTERYGHPEPATVKRGLQPGPAIVVSGHDMADLEELLKQTEGTGVKIYTHGEMLPAHGYPGLRAYRHLAGHFGTAWQNQQKEFDGAPAAFLFTTNCIQKPRDSYKDQVFTCGLVGWPDVRHIENRDFSPVIEKAKALGGSAADQTDTTLTTGFGRNAVMGVADTVVEAVKSGAIRHFFLVGGCDGAKPGRNYYTELVEKTPKDTVVLTLACGKFRFNDLDIGEIGGIPRLLDVGQCNDAYSAIKIAEALAGAFNVGVNELPLNLILSWYEQKAVVILLSLLSLGIKGIRLGPSLPAFITPNVLDFLVEKFDIKPIGSPQEDLAAILG